jgi:hypothetical protein
MTVEREHVHECVLRGRDLKVVVPPDLDRGQTSFRLLDLAADLLQDAQDRAQANGDDLSFLGIGVAVRAIRFAATTAATAFEKNGGDGSPVPAVEIEIPEKDQQPPSGDKRNGKYPLQKVVSSRKVRRNFHDTLECGHEVVNRADYRAKVRRCPHCTTVTT